MLWLTSCGASLIGISHTTSFIGFSPSHYIFHTPCVNPLMASHSSFQVPNEDHLKLLCPSYILRGLVPASFLCLSNTVPETMQAPWPYCWATLMPWNWHHHPLWNSQHGIPSHKPQDTIVTILVGAPFSIIFKSTLQDTKHSDIPQLNDIHRENLQIWLIDCVAQELCGGCLYIGCVLCRKTIADRQFFTVTSAIVPCQNRCSTLGFGGIPCQGLL